MPSASSLQRESGGSPLNSPHSACVLTSEEVLPTPSLLPSYLSIWKGPGTSVFFKYLLGASKKHLDLGNPGLERPCPKVLSHTKASMAQLRAVGVL